MRSRWYLASMRALRLLTVAMLCVAAVSVPAAPAAATGDSGCWVKNVRTGVVGDELQAAVTAASAGDRLKVRGTCGSFVADKDITLSGPATLTWPECTTGECGPPGILGWVESGARVVLTDLWITGGGSTWSGGAVHNYGVLVLRGRTAITDSLAEDGGGGVYNEGTMVMRDLSLVARNSLLYGYGGGILNRGTLVLKDRARVVANDGFPNGGGIYNAGLLVLKDSARVAGNSAETGGGVYNEGTMRLSGYSKVTRNTVSLAGGGIYSTGTVRVSRHWHGTYCGNTPDDFGACP